MSLMRRFMLLLAMMIFSTAAAAQDFAALARIDGATSHIRDTRSGVEISLRLSQIVPYRVYTLDAPRRLVVDFKEVAFSDLRGDDILRARKIREVALGAFRPGWSRMVAMLETPLALETAEILQDPKGRFVDVRITLADVDDEVFLAQVGAPPDLAVWELSPVATDPQTPPPNDELVIAIDPGHGGIDPGATRDGVEEAQVMLALAREVAEAVNRSGAGLRAVLTRDSDRFVSLDERMTIARAAGARALVSLHADALEGGGASGASVYTLTEDAEDRAAERMAERHGRGDLLAGLDLTGQDDGVAVALMELARQETGPASDRLAETLVETFEDVNVRLSTRARREAGLAVLRSPDFASVLLEVGFLSDDADRAMLADADTRVPLVAAIVVALRRWAEQEATLAPLHRN